MSVEQFLESTWGAAETSVRRDLYLNLRKLLEEGPLDEPVRYLNLLAVARSLGNRDMEKFAEGELSRLDVGKEMRMEATECAAIMGMLNTYYKFKSYLPAEKGPDYQRAGLRMQSLAKPVVGKEIFEMMSFAVSVVNGCPSCIASHEKALRDLGVDAEKIHELARLAAVAKGLTGLAPVAGS